MDVHFCSYFFLLYNNEGGVRMPSKAETDDEDSTPDTAPKLLTHPAAEACNTGSDGPASSQEGENMKCDSEKAPTDALSVTSNHQPLGQEQQGVFYESVEGFRCEQVFFIIIKNYAVSHNVLL
jgi:hypothetical protein